MDVARLTDNPDSGIVTHQDWMVSALLALNQPKKAQIEIKNATLSVCAIEDSKEVQQAKESENKSGEALPTGDSSNVYVQSTGPKTDAESALETPAND